MPTTGSVRSKIRLANTAGAQQQQGVPPVENQSDFTSTQAHQADAPARMNPLAELIDDETFQVLEQYGLIHAKSMRDYHIRKSYWEMRRRMCASDAIDQLQQTYPYLQHETIRKIVYHVGRPLLKLNMFISS